MRPIPVELNRSLCAGIVAALIAAQGATLAQDYPVRPIRLIVPAAPGTTADIGSRFIAEELSKAVGQPVVVENKPGAGGTIGTAELSRAAPDGYTIGFASQASLVFNQAIYARPGYDSLRDFAPIGLMGGTSNVLVMHPSNTASTLDEVIATAKSNPGRLTFASGGSGTTQHLYGVLFGRATGTDLVHVPYRSAQQAVLAVMRNEVTMGFFNTPLVIGPIRDGKLKALAVTSLERLPLLPNVPTLDEKGVKGIELNSWGGLVAPAGTSPEIVARLNAELIKISSNPETRERRLLQGFESAPLLTPAAFAELIADDLTRWVPVVKASGAKVD
jgi:tripartite-type tricarboxylate transporter receptor subunit TctC